MSIIFRNACNPSRKALSFAKKLALTLDGKSNEGKRANRIYDGYIITVRNSLGNAIVSILEPPGFWVFGTVLAKSFYLSYNWERNIPATDRYIGALQIGGASMLAYTDQPQQEADIKTMSPDDLIYFPKRRWHNLGERVQATFLTLSPLTENGGIYTMAAAGRVTNSTPDSGYELEGAILVELVSPQSTFAHWSNTESDTTKNFSSAAVNQQQIFIRQNAMADITNAASPCLITNPALVRAYDTPYAVCIREIEPEIHNGQELPLRYRDVLMVIPYIDSRQPAEYERVKEDTGITSLPFAHGFTVVRAHLPYDYENETGEQALEVTWFKDVSMLDSNIEKVVPAEYVAFVVELDGVYYDGTKMWPTPTPPSELTFPQYYEGYEYHHILSMSYAVREPPLGEPPATPPPLPEGALPENYDPAQLLVVQTTLTTVYDPANGGSRDNWNLGPGGDPDYQEPNDPAMVYYYVSTRAYTFDLVAGAYTEVEIDGTQVRADGLFDDVGLPEDDPGVKFPVYYTYAAVGQAVPCVKVEVDTKPSLFADKDWSHTDSLSDLQNYEGNETPNSTKFVLVYPGGTTTEFNLGTWCPVRPVMRGLVWSDYISLMVFSYDNNDPDAVSKTITRPDYFPKAFFFDRDPLEDPIVSMRWLDNSLIRQRTIRRFCEPQLCSSQKIAGALGNGKIAILCCPMEQKETAVKLDWSVVVAYEESGAFIEERSIVFEQQPLESSCWLSMTIQKPEIANLDTGEIIQEAVIVVSLQKPRVAHHFVEAEGYNRASDNIAMHLIQNRNYTFPRERVDPAELVTDASSEQKISTDGGRTWRVLIRDMPGDGYYMGSQISPRVPEG